MMPFAPFFARVETTALAKAVGESTLITGLLSGIHLLGLTLIVGSTLVTTLRLLGVLLPDHPVKDVIGATRRGIAVALTVSVTSGLLLFAPRASLASQDGIFQVKMLLLCAAAAFHFAIYRTAAREHPEGHRAFVSPRATGALGLALWIGVALAGCAFILLE